jgi:hypothetical protein
VFGVAAASRNTRFQAARYALPGPDLHRLIAPALPGAFHLFDHLVGGREQRLRHGEAERPGRLGVDDKLELGRLHDRQVRRLGAPPINRYALAVPGSISFSTEPPLSAQSLKAPRL